MREEGFAKRSEEREIQIKKSYRERDMATAEVGTVIGCHSVDDWKSHFQRGADSKKLVLGLERLPYLSDDSKHGLDLLRTLTGLIHIISRNVVVDFTASWCGPCRVISPVLAELAKKFIDVIFLKVDVDELKTVAGEWEVEAMPTFLFLKEGKLVDKLVGAKKDELPRLIEKHAAVATSTSSA